MTSAKTIGFEFTGNWPVLAVSYHTTFRHLQQVKCRNAKRELKPCSGCRAGHWRRQAHSGGGSQEVLSKRCPSVQQPDSAGHRKASRHKRIYPQERCRVWNKHPAVPLLSKRDHFVPCKRPYLEQVPCTSSPSPCPLLLHSHQGAGENAQAIHTAKMK